MKTEKTEPEFYAMPFMTPLRPQSDDRRVEETMSRRLLETKGSNPAALDSKPNAASSSASETYIQGEIGGVQDGEPQIFSLRSGNEPYECMEGLARTRHGLNLLLNSARFQVGNCKATL
jgi:hypothetical protein